MKVRWKCGRRNLTRRRDWNVKIRDEVPPPWRQRMRGRWPSVLMIETGDLSQMPFPVWLFWVEEIILQQVGQDLKAR